MIGLEKFLNFLLGASFFFPGFSLFTVGNMTGIQVALPLAVLCGLLRLRHFKLGGNVMVVSAHLLWILCLFVSCFLAGFRSTSVNPMLVFWANLGILFMFSLGQNPHPGPNRALISGVVAGAAISVAYALYQQLGAYVNLPYIVPPLNNKTYAQYADDANFTDGRSYAFTPEPSVLGCLLIPTMAAAVCYAASGKRFGFLAYGMLALLFAGQIASSSFATVLTLPMALLIGLMVTAKSNSRRFVGAAVALALLVGLIAAVYTVDSLYHIADRVFQRVQNFRNDESLVGRAGLMIAAFRIFLDNPWFGDGVIPAAASFAMYMPAESMVLDQHMGGGTVFLLILCGHGIIAFSCFAWLAYTGIRRSRSNPALCGFLIGCLICMAIQTAYETLYHFWVAIGVAISVAPAHAPTPAQIRALLRRRSPSPAPAAPPLSPPWSVRPNATS